MCVEGSLTSAMTLVKKNTQSNAVKAFRISEAPLLLEEVKKYGCGDHRGNQIRDGLG